MSEVSNALRKVNKGKSAMAGAGVAVPAAGSAFNTVIASGMGLAFPAAPALLATAIVAGGAWLGWRVGSIIVGEIADWLDDK